MFVCILGCLIFLSNSYAQTSGKDEMASLATGNTAFACDLYAKLQEKQGNLFFSPYSISTALAMTYAGARGNTATQMAEVLHFSLEQEALHSAFFRLSKHFQELEEAGDIALKIANALWIQEDLELLEEFRNINERYYGANLFPVNFKKAFEEAREQINAWVAKQTHEKIQDLLAEGVLDHLTRLVLTNGIYFQGNWHHPFDESLTREGSFWVSPDKTVTVPMMSQTNSFYYGGADSLEVLALPYSGEDLYMVILLPEQNDGLPKIEKMLNAQNIRAWISILNSRKTLVFLPKFTFASNFPLKETLQMMGMTDAFSKKSDFSGIASHEELVISDVIHKAFVEVNEKGTEAAAATGVVAAIRSMPPEFKADHPFIFFVWDTHTESILFLGRVVNPAE